MIKKILVIALAPVICYSMNNNDQSDQLENFPTAHALANQCLVEGDWDAYNNYNRAGRYSDRENELLWIRRRTDVQEREYQQLRAERREREQQWMRNQLEYRRNKRRRAVTMKNAFDALGVDRQDPQQQRREEQQAMVKALQDDNTQWGVTSRESVSSLHPYLTFSIFGTFLLILMYKFAYQKPTESAQ